MSPGVSLKRVLSKLSKHAELEPRDVYFVTIPPCGGALLAEQLNVVPWCLKGLWFEAPEGPCRILIDQSMGPGDLQIQGLSLSRENRHSAIRLAKASTKRRRKRKLPPRRKYVPKESIRVTVGDFTCTGDSLGPLLPEAD